jgi:Flp pilus assembly protein TadB
MTVVAALLAGAAVAVWAAGRPAGPMARLRRVMAATPPDHLDQGQVSAFPAAWPAQAPSARPAGARSARPAGARSARPAGARSARPARAPSSPPARLLAAAAGGLGIGVLVGGVAGVLAGVTAGTLLHGWLARLEPRAERLRRAAIEADLPMAADLLAACLLAGSSIPDAVQEVADAVPGPLAAEFRRVVAMLRLGGDQAGSWLPLTEDPVLAPLGWSLARASEGGATVASAVIRIADEQRMSQRWAAEAAARQVGVRVAAPLGLCFLPAFVLIGIVPVVAGIASGVAA